MTTDLGKYHFLPWLRRGIGAAIGNADVDPLPDRAKLQVHLAIDATLNGTVTPVSPPDTIVMVYGPGDILGIDPNIVIRTEPRNLTSNFEPNYLAGIEFDSPDFPWLFTPAAPVDDRLRPWIALIALKADEFKEPPTQTVPLPSIGITKIKALQNLSENWCWAHVQLSSDDSVDQILQNDPSHAISRLLCPRRLDPETSYDVFLVPAFDIGRKAGLGMDVSTEKTSAPAWTFANQASDSTPYPMPYYYRFSFHTSDEGDFESLVRRLNPIDLPPSVGTRPMAVNQPGAHIPSAGPPLGLEGALIRVGTQPTEWKDPERNEFQTTLQSFLNLTTSTIDDPAKPNPDDPRIVAPIYGRWHAGVNTVDRTHVGWLDDLNFDPRWRTAGGFGTEVVQTNRTPLLASAWQQVSGIIAANRLLRQAQLARASMFQLYSTQLRPTITTTLLRWTAPVHARIMASQKTVLANIRNSPIPERMFSGAFRRVTRPLGPLRRRQGVPPQQAGTLITGVNDGTLEIVPPAKPPAGTVSIEQVSERLQSSLLRDIFLLVLAIIVMLVFGATLGGVGTMITILVVAVAVIVLASTTIRGILGRFHTGNTMHFSSLTATSILTTPSRPSFAVTLPGQPTQFVSASGTSDSVDGAAFRQATSDIAGMLQVEQPTDPTYAPLPLDAMRTTLLARLDPTVTIAARTKSMIRISGFAWNPRDPITPIMAAPEFLQSMYFPLKELPGGEEYILPGVENIPQNSLGLLQSNHAFIEAYMVGLNHEMARQLLVNHYPTDQRGSYFRQFWDVSCVPRPGDPTDETALHEMLKDIPPIHTWPRDMRLGLNENRHDIVQNNLVLVVRGELLKRYPNTIIFAGKAVIDPKDGKRRLDESLGADKLYKHPIFWGPLPPDITFFGFNLTADEALGRTSDAPHGYFFGFMQVPTEPRFGLEPIEAHSPVPYWAELSWKNFAERGLKSAASPMALPTFEGGYSTNRLQSTVFQHLLDSNSIPDFVPATIQPSDVKILTKGDNDADGYDHNVYWAKDSAQAAYILLRRPFRIMVHADRMIKNV
jgi:hypothetical protein